MTLVSLWEARPTLSRWMTTCAATAASTYALDILATSAGLLLVASQILDGLSWPQALIFLALSYLAWGAGLQVNLKANWKLLERTGTSTNILSKVAFDIAARRGATRRARELWAGAGYVVTELGKEAPYYVAAIGAAAATDAVTALDALIFLAGANIGAAGYEYGLASAVSAMLRRLKPVRYARFEDEWEPLKYLADFYSQLETDERFTMAFFADSARHIARDEPILFFGVGPTLHHVFPFASIASEMHLGDYLRENLDELDRWIANDPRAHDWRPFVRYALQCEGNDTPTASEIVEREEAIRGRITQLLNVDCNRVDPLGGAGNRQYAAVVSAYCADSITSDRDAWQLYMDRIVALVQPGGVFLTAALRNAKGYKVDGKEFPSADIDESDMRRALRKHFREEDIDIRVHAVPECAPQGYSGIVLACARNRLRTPRSSSQF